MYFLNKISLSYKMIKPKYGSRIKLNLFQHKPYNFFFFFDRQKSDHILEVPKRRRSTVHMKCREKGKEQKNPFPYFKLNRSTKSNIDVVWSLIYTLAQFTKVYKKKMDLIAWSNCLA